VVNWPHKMDILTKLIPAKPDNDDEGKSSLPPLELTALQEEVQQLRIERSRKEASETSLLGELQRRCNRVIELETQLDDTRGQARRLQLECDAHRANQKQLMSLLRATSSHTSTDIIDECPVVESVVALKAHIAALEQGRWDGKRLAAQQEEEVGSLRTQMEELKRVLVAAEKKAGHTAAGEDHKEGAPSARDLGLPEDVHVLLQRCPWTEAVLGNILVTEELYEWEAWSLFHGWSGAAAHLSQATPDFRDMVLQCTDPPKASTSHSDGDGPRPAYRRQDKTITDVGCTTLVNPDAVVLPAVGWEWLGGWRPEDGKEGGSGAKALGAMDQEGWSYGTSCEELVRGHGSESMLIPVAGPGARPGQGGVAEEAGSIQGSGSNTAASPTKPAPQKRRIRRRRWVRVRVLAHVPGASDMVNGFLGLRARVASLEAVARKLSEQVLSLQGALNDREVQAARSDALERALVAMQGRLQKAERSLGRCRQQLAGREEDARVQSRDKEGHKEGQEGGGLRAVGEAVSEWFAGLGSESIQGQGLSRDEGGKDEPVGGGEGREESGGLKKWLFDVKSSLGRGNGVDAAACFETEGHGTQEDAHLTPAVAQGTSRTGVHAGNSTEGRGDKPVHNGDADGGATPLIKNAFRWFSKEVLQHASGEDPIESWAEDGGETGLERVEHRVNQGGNGEEREDENVPIEHLSETEIAKLRKQLYDNEEKKEAGKTARDGGAGLGRNEPESISGHERGSTPIGSDDQALPTRTPIPATHNTSA